LCDPAMDDWQVAARELRSRNVNLLIVKKGLVLYESSDPGIGGVLKAIEDLGDELYGSTLADKIVGRAVAMLCLYCRVRYVYAISMTEGAHQLLTERGIPHTSETYIQRLMNRRGTDLCPFEMAIREIRDPEEAFKVLKKFSAELRVRRLTDSEYSRVK